MISKGCKSIFPIKHKEIWDRYKLHIQSFWTPEEVSLHDDLRDLQKLNAGEKNFINQVLAFFANSEAMINENLASRFYKEILIPEARCFISIQMLNESIHAEMYALQIETYVQDPDEKDKLFSAIENVIIPQLINGSTFNTAKKRAIKLLSDLGLSKRLYNKPRELSGGEKQRVSILRAIANMPKIILADEPTGNLDKQNSKNVVQIIKDLVNHYNISFIIATHNLSIIKKFDKIVKLSEGKII